MPSEMKHCPRCDVTKLTAEFSRNRTKAGGLETNCRACRKEINRTYKEGHRDKIRALKRESEKRRAARNPLVRERQAEAIKRWERENPEKKRAHRIVGQAVRSGALQRPDECVECAKSSPSSLHGHHDDYSKPLEVRWLCARCHGATHDRLPMEVAS